MEKASSSSFKKKGILAKNTLINLVGYGIPLLFAVAALPFVIDGLGTERFGVLAIVWIIIGYFGVFDMGIGKATTKFVADFEARGRENLSPIILTSIALLVIFGLFWSLLIIVITPTLVYDILNIPAALVGESEEAFYILSISIPFVLGSMGARGALEAQQQFAIVNTVKIPASIINYAGPLLVLPFSNQLQPIVAILVIARIITFLLYSYFCLRGRFNVQLFNYPILRWAKELLGFGAWITVSSLISPIMVYMDRFIIGAILTMSAVAYYTTPYEIISRLLILSGGFMGVMFPAFSVFSLENKEGLVSLFNKSIRYLLAGLVPVVIFFIFGANSLLYFWLGSEFATNSTLVLQLLAGGILINSVASVPYTALQAGGRPDIPAKLHMVELPLYLGMIWYFTTTLGIVGVALAWVIRVSLDGLMLLYFFDYHVPFLKKKQMSIVSSLALYGMIFLIMGFVFQVFGNRYLLLVYAVICAGITFCVFWFYTFNNEDRERLYRLYRELKQELRGNN